VSVSASTKIDGFTVSIERPEQISYALAHGGLPILTELTIESSSASKLAGAIISLTVESLGVPLTEAWVKRVGSGDSASITIERPEIIWKSGELLDIADTQPAEIVVVIEQADGKAIRAVLPSSVSSADAWYEYSPLGSLSLASFVRPNDPRLREILDVAGGSLLASSGWSGLSGYQSPDRVMPMVQALYEAVQGLEITYSNPPAGWDVPGGQRIRSTAQILDERVGTCLDTAVLFAALLENIGLYPQIALVPAHAFVGFWTPNRYTDSKLPSNLIGPLRSEINELDLGNLYFFETTSVAKSAQPTSFADAVKSGREHIAKNAVNPRLDEVSHFIDLVACRRPSPQQVLPMPIRRTRSDGTVELIEYKPEEFTVNLLLEQLTKELVGKDKGFSGVDLDVPPRLQTWLDSLLDLSLRNPLINFRFPRTSLPLLIPSGSLGAVEDILAQETPMSIIAVESKGQEGVAEFLANNRLELPPHVEPFAIDQLRSQRLVGAWSSDYSLKLLRSMTSQAKSVLEETGSNGLFLAMGFLSWDADRKQRFQSKAPDEGITLQTSALNPAADTAKGIRSPLILIPVTLTPKNRFREFSLSLDPTSPITPNFSLIEKLRRDYGITLDSLANLEEDESGIDVSKALDGIRQVIKANNLEGFRVDEGAVLGFFNFSTYRLWKDLIDNWRLLSKAPLFRHLLHSPHKPFNPKPATDSADPTPSDNRENPATESVEDVDTALVDDAVSDIDLDALMGELPIPADASQARAVARASRGETFVLQGPPGTGKSQTITNMLAHGLKQGQRILFVAQKKEALDVVKERLDQVGLGGFSLDLHDKNQSLKAVKMQLLEVLDKEDAVDAVGFEVALKEYHQAFSPLRRYRERLHELGAHGESLYQAVDLLLATSGDKALTVPGSFIANNSVEVRSEMASVLANLVETGPVAGNTAENPWSFLAGAHNPDELSAELKILVEELNRNRQVLESSTSVVDFLINLKSLDEIRHALLLDSEEGSPGALSTHQTQISRQARLVAHASLERLRTALESKEADYSATQGIPVDALMQEEQLSRSKNALSRLFTLRRMQKVLNNSFGRPVALTRADVPQVLSELKFLSNSADEARSDLARVPGLRGLEGDNLFSLDTVARWKSTLGRIDALVALDDSFTERNLASPESITLELSQRNDLKAALMGLLRAAEGLLTIAGITDSTLALWAGQQTVGKRLWFGIPDFHQDLHTHSAIRLVRWLQLSADMKPLLDGGLDTAVGQLLSGEVSFSDGENAFLRGYYLALVDFLMVERGFDTFDQAPINAYITKFAKAQKQLQSTLPDVLSAELINRRGFDMSVKLGAVGDLLAEVKKVTSRRGSVRLLLRKHWDLIRRITPCVLASPDSVVRFIDADLETFDLVVFDEASMIKVATALGAIGRGRAAIVVGDTKQMPPTSVAQTKMSESDDDGEEDFVEDMESILSQVEVARLPEVMLKWHYRSEDESLIGFSNERYYNDKLLTFPAAEAKRPGYGLEFVHHPKGHFNRLSDTQDGKVGTNPSEAQAIIKTIESLLETKGGKKPTDSIGVVTLNKAQQTLITEMLQNHPSEAIQQALTEGASGETIFVKNLETVQGSERDIILLSVAFTTNKTGKLPLNFGPLNNSGGERRLNVAITRARKQMIVFSSFRGGKLLERDPASEGVRQLGEFLIAAEGRTTSKVAERAVQSVARDRHQEDVAEALRNAGLHVETDVGLSGFKVDIAIYAKKKDAKATLGILLDGQRWSSRETVSDRDALPVSFLTKRMGWPQITRIWLPTWIRHQENEIERIVALVNGDNSSASSALPGWAETVNTDEEPDSESLAVLHEDAVDEPPARWVDGTEDNSRETLSSFEVLSPKGVTTLNAWDSLLESVEVWRALRPSVVGSQEYMDYLGSPKVQQVVREIANQLTSLEGPVSRERFAKFVGACFGFSRVVKNRIDTINNVPLPAHSRDSEGFLFPPRASPKEYREWKRAGGQDSRTIAEISLAEIGNAMVHLAVVSMGITRPEILTETARILGSQRNSPAITQRMENALVMVEKTGRLRSQDGYLKPPS
jgi:hypothetical protein